MMSEGSTMPCGSFLKMPTLPGSLPSLPASTHHTGCHHHHLQHHPHGNHLKIMNNYEPTLKNPENLALAAGGWSGLRGAMQKVMIFRDKQSDRNTLHQNIHHHNPDHN